MAAVIHRPGCAGCDPTHAPDDDFRPEISNPEDVPVFRGIPIALALAAPFWAALLIWSLT